MKVNSRTKLNILISIMLIFAGVCAAKTIKENHSNGKRKLKYSVNKKGQKHGSYMSYYENGKLHIKCRYRKDLLHGVYIEKNKKNKVVWKANYKLGKLNGLATRYDKKGRLTWQGEYVNGELRFPMSLKFLGSQLKSISKWSPSGEDRKLAQKQLLELKKDKTVPKQFRNDDTFSKDRLNGLRRLMQYRMMCGVPYKHLRLHPRLNSHAQAASYICDQIQTISHTPQNPGLAEDVYKYSYHGTSHSNLTMNSAGVISSRSVDGYMDDSDPSNISRVGHRRWCLNPPMGYCGFGTLGKFGALYCFDTQGVNFEKYTKDYDWDFIKFPPQGYFPVKGYFKDHYAWSISVNPAKYQKFSKDDITVKLYVSSVKAVKSGELKPKGEPVELEFFNVCNSGIGTGGCIIFKPGTVNLKKNSTYIVEVEGLKDRQGKDVKLIYPVVFI